MSYTKTDGWLDAVKAGDEVLLVSHVGLGLGKAAAVAEVRQVERVTATQVVVDGRAFRRGPSKSTYGNRYRDEGEARGTHTWLRLAPVTPENQHHALLQERKKEAHEERERRRTKIERLLAEIRRMDSGSALWESNPTATMDLDAALDALLARCDKEARP